MEMEKYDITFLDEFFEVNRDAFCVIDKNLRIEYANPQIENYTDIKRKHLIGKTFREVFPIKKEPLKVDKFYTALNARKPQHWETFSEYANCWIEISTYHLNNDRLAITARDITDKKLLEMELNKCGQLYKMLFENTDDGFAVIELLYDADGIPNDFMYINANELFVRHTGRKLEEVLWKRASQIMPNIESSWFNMYDAVIKDRKPIHFINYNKDTNRWYETFCFLYYNDKVGVLFRDITEKKLMEENLHRSEERYKAFITACFDSFYLMSPDWRQMHVLNGKGVLADTQESDSNWAEKYIHPDDWTFVSEVINEAIMNKTNFDLNHRVFKEDGSLGWTHSRAVPILNEDGDIVEWIGAASDITERKIAEETLRESVRKAQELAIKLRKADEIRNFISTLSHELRNPLATISMGLSLIEQFIPGSEKDVKTRSIINRQTAQLIRLVDDLLDVSRITRNKIELKMDTIEVNRLVEETLEEFRNQFNDKGLVLEEEYFSDPLYIYADAVCIKQVIGNLLSNSLKFTNNGGKVRLTVCKDIETHDVVIKVCDSGIGIAPELLPNLFEPFVQADNSPSRSLGGLGLGLSIVKGIVELHEGSITVRSEGLDKGTEFTINFATIDYKL